MRLLGMMTKTMSPKPHDIRRWLRRQPWYRDFVGHVRWNDRVTLRHKLRILSGRKGEATMTEAFDFGITVEGARKWRERNEQFINWFTYEYRNEKD